MRQSLGLTQEQLAQRTQATLWPVSRTTIGDLEAGRHSPAMTTVIALCDLLHADPMEVADRLKRAVPGPDARLGLGALDARSQERFASGHYRETLSVLDEMMARIAAKPARERARLERLAAVVEIRRASTLRRLGAYTAAQGSAERAVEQAGEWPELLADAYVTLAEARLRLGKAVLATDAVNRASDVCRSCDDSVQTRVWNEMGRVLLEAGRYEEARQAFLESRRRAMHGGDEAHQSHCEGNIGLCLLHLGKRSQARARIANAIELARKIRRPVLEAAWLVELGRLAHGQKRLEEAERCAKSALRIAQPRELWDTVFRATMLLHRVAKAREPDDPDAHRIAFMKKLAGWVEEEAADADLQAFLLEIRSGGKDSGEGDA